MSALLKIIRVFAIPGAAMLLGLAGCMAATDSPTDENEATEEVTTAATPTEQVDSATEAQRWGGYGRRGYWGGYGRRGYWGGYGRGGYWGGYGRPGYWGGYGPGYYGRGGYYGGYYR